MMTKQGCWGTEEWRGVFIGMAGGGVSFGRLCLVSGGSFGYTSKEEKSWKNQMRRVSVGQQTVHQVPSSVFGLSGHGHAYLVKSINVSEHPSVKVNLERGLTRSGEHQSGDMESHRIKFIVLSKSHH